MVPYQGWTWRGARLEITELAAHLPEEPTLHLGIARTRLDPVLDFPVLFRVYAHRAWADPANLDEICFPPDTEFHVRDVQSIVGDRMCLLLGAGRVGSALDDGPVDGLADDPGIGGFAHGFRTFRTWSSQNVSSSPGPPLRRQ